MGARELGRVMTVRCLSVYVEAPPLPHLSESRWYRPWTLPAPGLALCSWLWGVCVPGTWAEGLCRAAEPASGMLHSVTLVVGRDQGEFRVTDSMRPMGQSFKSDQSSCETHAVQAP